MKDFDLMEGTDMMPLETNYDETHVIVTVCDGDTWGGYDHATVIVYPEGYGSDLDFECDIRPEDVKFEEYDLEEYVQMRIDEAITHWVEENM